MEDVSLFAVKLRQLFEEVLSDETDVPLSSEICQTLVQSPPDCHVEIEKADIIDSSFSPGLQLLLGYPSYPLYNRMANVISYWMITGKCPVLDLPVMFMLNEQAIIDIRAERIEAITPKLVGAYSLWDCWSDGEKKFFMKDVLKELGVRGLLDILGVRQTAGSVDVLPPPKEVLLNTFVKLHSPSAKLTVGGRALSKHHHRDDSTSWWGNCTGTEDEKNKHALKLILKILANATWINIHFLPHDLKVVEMRTIEGYGARWRLDGSEFRGFLEPQMEDGHAVGWKH